MLQLISYEISKWFHCRILNIGFIVLLIINLLFTHYYSVNCKIPISDINNTEYSQTLESICLNADKNMEKLKKIGVDENQYTYRYQQKIREIYGNLKENVYISECIVSPSWCIFLGYDLVNLFVLLYVIALQYTMFLEDRSGGMWNIIRASHNGRSVIIVVKFVVFALIIFIVSILYQLSSLAFVITFNGGEGVLETIQKVAGYELAPFNVKIVSVLLACAFQRATVIALLSMISVFFTVLSGHPMISLFSTLAWYLIGYIISLFPHNSTWIMSNFYTLLSPTLSVTRYYSVNFFNIPVDSIKVACALITILFIISLVGSYIVMFNEKKKVTRLKTFKLQKTMRYLSIKGCKSHSVSLINHEIYKCFGMRTVIEIFIILLANILMVYSSYNEMKISTSYTLINDYIDSMNGLSNIELLKSAEEDFNDALKLIDMESEITNKFFSGEINSQEFSEYNQEISRAKSMLKPLDILISRLLYLINIEETKNIECLPVFSKPIEMLVGNDFNIMLFLAVIFTAITISTKDYHNNNKEECFLPIMTVCKMGRERTFLNKIIIAISSVLCFCLIFYITDFIAYIMNEDTVLLSLPIVSLPTFEGTDSNISINTWLLWKWISIFISYILMVGMIFIMSHFIRNTIFLYIVTAAVTVLPRILSLFGIDMMKYLDYTILMSGTGIYIISSNYFNCDYTLSFIIYLGLFSIELIALHKCFKEIKENC